MKVCGRCKKSKPLSEYQVDRQTVSGLHSYCKSCVSYYSKKDYKEKGRERHLKKRYNITSDEYGVMFTKQNGKCAICGSLSPKRNRMYFSIDHNHLTGKIRGLLCHHCNYAIGLFSDNIKTIENAVAYLKKGDSIA